jgi:hypothetical protein
MKKRRGSVTRDFQNLTLPPIEVDDELRNACAHEDAKHWIPAEDYRIDVEHLKAAIGLFRQMIGCSGTDKKRKRNSELAESNKNLDTTHPARMP